ncbi:MAG: hypothetical protein HRU03_05350 [Nanoarchaeales archaeon]|nr:hypothetical protein [Nanoarchaeales archaeon]
MLRYEVINRLYFLKQLNEFDFKFRSLVFNRISYLEKEPLKYACVGVESLKLYTLRIIDKGEDIKIVFKLFGNKVFIVFLFEMELTSNQIRKKYLSIE